MHIVQISIFNEYAYTWLEIAATLALFSKLLVPSLSIYMYLITCQSPCGERNFPFFTMNVYPFVPRHHNL